MSISILTPDFACVVLCIQREIKYLKHKRRFWSDDIYLVDLNNFVKSSL